MKITPQGITFLTLTMIFTVTGQLLIKHGMLRLGPCPALAAQLPPFVWRTFTNPWVMGGLCCAVSAMVCWTLTLSRVPLSFGYPFFGVAIALVIFLTPLVVHEPISWTRIIGVLVVCLGIWLTAR